MIETTKIVKSGVEEIQDVSVNFNWEYEEGKKPDRINANAYTPKGMSLNVGYYPGNATQEIQIYGLTGDFPVDLLSGIKAKFETINQTFVNS